MESTGSDAVLVRLITACSAWIEKYLNRSIASADYAGRFDGHGGSRLMLPDYPVTSVSSVTVDDISIPPAPDSVSSGFVFSPYGVYLRGYLFNRGSRNVQISWTAGYSSVPADIEQAAIHLVSARFREKDRIGQASKVVAGETVSFSIKDMPADVAAMLGNYKKVVPI
jgi:hypothetical protein